MIRPFAAIPRGMLVGAMFVYFGAGSAALSYGVLPWVNRGVRDPARRARRAQPIIARGFVGFHDLMRWFRLIDFDPRNADLPLPAGPCVVVSNHPTLVDVTAISAVIRGACTVVKDDYFSHPLMGPLMRHAWNIRAGRDVETGVVDESVARIAAGLRVLIFPEGTRSPPGAMRRLRRGAFEVACRAKVPAVLVWVGCTPPALARGVPFWSALKGFSRMSVEVLATLHPEDFDHDAKAMLARAKDLYTARLRRWNAEHPDDLSPPADARGREGA